MSDLIDRDAAIAFVDCGYLRPPTELAWSDKDVVDMLKRVPSAQPTQNNTSNALTSLDCIDRQAAIEVADAVWSVTGDKNVAKVWDQLKDLPSAQPEIIRCRDCKHYHYADSHIPQEQMCTCEIDGNIWSPDSYCSFAERRQDESEKV